MLDAGLVSEIEIVHAIYVKFRAQQRGQRWWKYVAILHRRLLRFVQANKVDKRSAAFIVHKLSPAAARAFHSVLAQGAFITLGFALIAALARVRSLLLPYVAVRVAAPSVVEAPSEDLGEQVSRDGEHAPQGALPKQPKPAKPKAKKKRKSKHSEIDDIFG